MSSQGSRQQRTQPQPRRCLWCVPMQWRPADAGGWLAGGESICMHAAFPGSPDLGQALGRPPLNLKSLQCVMRNEINDGSVPLQAHLSRRALAGVTYSGGVGAWEALVIFGGAHPMNAAGHAALQYLPIPSIKWLHGSLTAWGWKGVLQSNKGSCTAHGLSRGKAVAGGHTNMSKVVVNQCTSLCTAAACDGAGNGSRQQGENVCMLRPTPAPMPTLPAATKSY